jgi:outer membrane protein OmpA-like peptidoglycan-associated protein
MKQVSKVLQVLLMSAFALNIGQAVAADASEAAQMEALKQALQSGGSADGKPKLRKRAIVFDDEAGGGAAAGAANTVQNAVSNVVSGRSAGCSGVSADAKATPIAFSIQFKVGSADLQPSSETTLSQIGKLLALTPEKCVIVEGHTDSSGNADKNLALSQSRADSVVRYLVDREKLGSDRLLSKGRGSSEPASGLVPTDPKNRRVVFKVVTG